MILAVTGHRPDKLGGYALSAYLPVLQTAKRAITRLKPDMVLTGMALGWDQAIAEACVSLKIPFTAVIPSTAQSSRWPFESKAKYDLLLAQAKDCIDYSKLTGNQGLNIYQLLDGRNHCMVDNCDKLLTLYNGDKSGGTYNCIIYAQSKQRDIVNCWPMYQKVLAGDNDANSID